MFDVADTWSFVIVADGSLARINSNFCAFAFPYGGKTTAPAKLGVAYLAGPGLMWKLVNSTLPFVWIENNALVYVEDKCSGKSGNMVEMVMYKYNVRRQFVPVLRIMY